MLRNVCLQTQNGREYQCLFSTVYPSSGVEKSARLITTNNRSRGQWLPQTTVSKENESLAVERN